MRLHHPAVMRVVPVFRNGDKVMDGSVDVWVLALPLPPWTALRSIRACARQSSTWPLRGTGWGGRRGSRAGGDGQHRGDRRVRAGPDRGCAAGQVLRCAAGRVPRDKCFAALRDECTGTSASLRCVTSAPRQSAQRLRRLRRRWTRSWRRSRRALEELT